MRQAIRSSDDARRALILVEDDPFLRLLPVILDPQTAPDMIAAFADFMAHDEPDFLGWCARLRARVPRIDGSRVVLFRDEAALLSHLPDADALVIESQRVGTGELAAARRLGVVQKYGIMLRNIDMLACARRGVEVLTIRRRANIQCAEHIFALMLSLARKIHTYQGKLAPEQLAALGHDLSAFDRRYTPNGNWARVPGLRSLNGSTIGIIGLGEIGREVALRADAFGMRILYHQRTRLDDGLEQALRATYVPLDDLLGESDWVVPQVPGSPATFHLLDAGRLARMKRGAAIVNVSRPDLVDRRALIAALRSGQIGGFALDPPYDAPGRADDELLAFPNVVITPHFGGSPRANALADFEQMVTELARALERRAG